MALVYRTHVRIIADILNTARDCSSNGSGVSITVLIRKANVSYARITKILGRLVDIGLLEVPEKGASRYRLSERGMEFLKAYSTFEGFVESFGLNL